MQRMTLDGQDQLRLLISRLGNPEKIPLNLKAVFNGLCASLETFKCYCGEMTEEFNLFLGNVTTATAEITQIYDEFSLPNTTILGNRNTLKKWIILEGLDNSSKKEEVLKYVGSYFSLLLNDQKANKKTPHLIDRLLNKGEEFLSDQAQRDLGRILYKATSKYSTKKGTFEQTIRGYFFYKNLYASAKTRQSVVDWHAMTQSEFLFVSDEIFQNATRGNHAAIAVAIASLTGLPLHLVNLLPINSKFLDEWVMCIDLELGVLFFDLSAIYTSAAKPGINFKLYESSSSVVCKPLPSYLLSIIQSLAKEKAGARTLGDLLENQSENLLKIDVSRFLNSCARFATSECDIDQFVAAILICDFRSIPSAKTYYKRTTRQTIWDASNRYYSKLGWGEAVPFVDGLSVGSAMVSHDHVVQSIFQKLAESVEELRPSNRSSIPDLLEFHDHFCAYTATLGIFCLALRNANPIGINSRHIDDHRNYLIIDDKHVLGDASAMPVAITDSLLQQFIFWKIHCRCLLRRLKKLGEKENGLIEGLEGIVSGKNSPLFILSTKPHAASVSQISKFWSDPLVENFARHFWESKFSELGVSSRFSAAQIRHQSSGCLSWASDSDLVLNEFIKHISNAQEKVLASLNVRAIHGLSKRLSS